MLPIKKKLTQITVVSSVQLIVQIQNFLHTRLVVLLLGACHPIALLMGHDVCVRSVWQLRGLRWPGQHLFHLQSEDA